MLPETRSTVLTALRLYQDALVLELRMFPEHYRKGDGPGDRHRTQLAGKLLAVRRAQRELQPAPWPRWYSSEPLMAYRIEGR